MVQISGSAARGVTWAAVGDASGGTGNGEVTVKSPALYPSPGLESAATACIHRECLPSPNKAISDRVAHDPVEREAFDLPHLVGAMPGCLLRNCVALISTSASSRVDNLDAPDMLATQEIAAVGGEVVRQPPYADRINSMVTQDLLI